jgi:thiamine kinase-like enzyme
LAQHSTSLIDRLYHLESILTGEALPTVIVHGDYGLHNIVFRRGEELGLLDFELARLEWRLIEIVQVVSRYWDYQRPDMSDQIEAIIASYVSEYPLSPDEWRLFPEVWAYFYLCRAVLNCTGKCRRIHAGCGGRSLCSSVPRAGLRLAPRFCGIGNTVLQLQCV